MAYGMVRGADDQLLPRMRNGTRYYLIVATVALAAAPLWGQASPSAVLVRGMAYDSLRLGPLAGARITLGGSRVTTTDSRGRFFFDSVPAGVYTLTAEHAALDSIGFSGISTRSVIGPNGDDVRIATPSFRTLWGVACGRAPPPNDSGLVYGTVRDVGRVDPVDGADVRLSWADVGLTRKNRVMRERWIAETRSDTTGTYVVCGVPIALGLRVQATRDSSASGAIDLPPTRSRVQRRDLLIGPPGTDSSRLGTVVGIVTTADGRAVPYARIFMDGLPERQTGSDGRFIVRGVPAGTRQLEVLTIGMVPDVRTVDVRPADTVVVSVALGKAVTLGGVKVTARSGRVLAAEFDARRRSGFGYAMDSTQISANTRFVNALGTIPSLGIEFRGSTIQLSLPSDRGGSCSPYLRIDDVPANYGALIDLAPEDVAAMEVYTHGFSIPMRFLPDATKPVCGLVLVWTKYAFRLR